MSTNEHDVSQLKQVVLDKANSIGVDMIGFAPVERWAEYKDIPEKFFPQQIWPWAKSVIVCGVQIFLPMLETTPSIVYSELYNTTNRILDEQAYQIANELNRNGKRAIYFPRDAYGDISVLVEKPEAAFSHVVAGKYAGLGTIGYNHTLITKEFGPRVRLVSVITDVEFEPTPMVEKELCIQCGMCDTCCPTNAFTKTDHIIAEMDKEKCAVYHADLKKDYRYPCGVCIKVCPVGNDRKAYGFPKEKYLEEKQVLKTGIGKEKYEDWNHIRDFGSR